ncbi:hypothetical protein [Wolbachia endosymbiont (group B) of Episyrphus balteatus]|nr:hypothetical protein [Wolbachia endosymbiont (group B) of Episyrphus balteatus]
MTPLGTAVINLLLSRDAGIQESRRMGSQHWDDTEGATEITPGLL